MSLISYESYVIILLSSSINQCCAKTFLMELTFINVYLLNFIVKWDASRQSLSLQCPMRISNQMAIRKTHPILISIVYWAFNLSFETLIDGASNFSPTIQYSVSDIIYNFELIFFNDMLHWSKSSLNMQHSLAICHPAST